MYSLYVWTRPARTQRTLLPAAKSFILKPSPQRPDAAGNGSHEKCALLAPSALGTLVRTFNDPGDRRKAFGVFGSVTVATDPDVQQLPLYFTAGLSARGLFDSRPRDAVSFGVATGYFSQELQKAQQNGQLVPTGGGVQDHETVVELTYRFDLRKYFIQPDFQYIVRPGGTGRLPNASVFGAQFGINF